jgi:hypothetical protein
MMFIPHREHAYWPPTACYEDGFTFLYVGDVRTSQETRLLAPTACYEDGFTFLYVNDVHTSKETGLLAPNGMLRGWLYFFICR